jgi:hypothetical protein
MNKLSIFMICLVPLSLIGMERAPHKSAAAQAIDMKLQNAFVAAAKKGNLAELKRLMRFKPRININAFDDTGMTALGSAIYGQQDKVIQFLIDNGADLEKRVEGIDPGKTPLMLAASVGNLAIVEMLLDAGADADETVTTGFGIAAKPKKAADYAKGAQAQEIRDALAGLRKKKLI